MLGIIFTGGDSPRTQAIKQLLDNEVKDALFIAADSGLAAMQEAGLTPDWVIGDFDSLDDKSRLDGLAPERVIRFEHDKDFTDTELAFSLAVQKGCDEIWIIGGGGGRIDHLFGIKSLFERDIYPLRWVTAYEDIRCLDAEKKHNELSLHFIKNAVVSVFPLGSGPWEAQSTGLKWPLSDLPWDRGFFGLSNLVVSGDFSITAKSGRFMVVLAIN